MDHFLTVLQGFWLALPFLISYFAASLFILFGGLFIYLKTTSINEVELIRSGNTAASVSLAGAVLAIAIPLAASLAASKSLSAVLVWGVAIVIIQLICDRLACLYIGDVEKRIESDELPTAITLSSIKISVGLLNSAAWG